MPRAKSSNPAQRPALTIAYIEAAPPEISISDVVLTEGNSGSVAVQFNVTLSAPSTKTVTVDFATADGSALAGSDYQAAAGTVTFAPGETLQTITVNVKGDQLVEAQENFFVNLSNPANASIADSQGQGTIANDDRARLSISDVTLAEGNAGTTAFTFTVTLDAAVDVPVSVYYSTADGSATLAGWRLHGRVGHSVLCRRSRASPKRSPCRSRETQSSSRTRRISST